MDFSPLTLKCKRCGHTWEYHGKKSPGNNWSFYTSCPICRNNVKVENSEEKKL